MPDHSTAGSREAASRAYKSWACTEDRSARTAPARQAFEARFDRQVDPDGLLTATERATRAGFARKAYFLDLAAKSARTRARRDRHRRADAALAAELLDAAAHLSTEVRP